MLVPRMLGQAGTCSGTEIMENIRTIATKMNGLRTIHMLPPSKALQDEDVSEFWEYYEVHIRTCWRYYKDNGASL